MNAPDERTTEDAFHKLIHDNSIYGLWEIASQMTPHPIPEAVPHIWKAALLKSLVRQSAATLSYFTKSSFLEELKEPLVILKKYTPPATLSP